MRKRWLILWLPLVFLALLPVLTSFLKNRIEVMGEDLLLPLLITLLTATMVALVYTPLFRRDRLAALLAGIAATSLLSDSYESRLAVLLPILRAINPIPALQSESLISLVVIATMLAVCYWLGVRVSRWWQKFHFEPETAATGLTIVVTVAFVLLAIPTLRAVTGQWPQFFYRPPEINEKMTATQKPDIFYIVLDRYTNQTVLKDQFAFDNSDFTDFLHQQNYLVEPNAHSNYPYTTMSIASTLNAGYHTDLIKRFSNKTFQILEPYHLAIRYASVIKALKKIGYHYDHVGSWYEASNQAPLADTNYQIDGRLVILNKTIVLNNFSKNLLTQSWLWRFVQPNLKLGHFTLLSYTQQGWQEMSLYQIETLKQLAKQPSGGRFIYAHILVPHDPYFFNADGSISPNYHDDNEGKPIKQKYIDQVKFINTQMKEILNSVNEKSQGQAIVVLQADEGPYPAVFSHLQFDYKAVTDELNSESMLKWSDQDLAMKYGTLAAYHLPGVDSQTATAGTNAVNIFRLIFNHYFDDHLPYLPNCQYAYPNGREKPFVFEDISQRLGGQKCERVNQ